MRAGSFESRVGRTSSRAEHQPWWHSYPAFHDILLQHSRHVDRKLFKMRELRGAGVVKVNHMPGEANPADLFTKILGRQVFEKHRNRSYSIYRLVAVWMPRAHSNAVRWHALRSAHLPHE